MQKEKIKNFEELLNILIEYNLIKRLSHYDNKFAIGWDGFILNLCVHEDGSVNEIFEIEE